MHDESNPPREDEAVTPRDPGVSAGEDPPLLWKAVGRDYTSRGGVRWDVGTVVTHPSSTRMVRDDASTYLSLSAEPGETLIGRSWLCRLLRVRPIGEVIDSDAYGHKRCVLSAEVVAEVEPWRALGPNGRVVAAVIDRCGRLTVDELRRIAAAWDAARAAAWDAAGVAAGDAAWDAAIAVVVADRVPPEHYTTLTAPLVSVVGPLDELPVPAWVDEIEGEA